MKVYVGKVSDEGSVLEAAGSSGPAIIAGAFSLDDVDVAFVGVPSPPDGSRLIHTLFAPVGSESGPERWEIGTEGRCWYTRDLCAARRVIA